MNLRELLGPQAPEVEVTDLAYSTRSVVPGSLFFCVRGFRADGHDFAPEAVERGAAALVCERPLGLGVPEVVVDDARAAMGPAAARFFGEPTAELRLVGITGTNGKTTTAYLVRAILEAAGIRCGLLGTVRYVIAGREHEVERTTPEAIDLQRAFRAMLDGGDRACAMEVSSHALALGRANGIRFASRVFTNLTQDHLDFHRTMDDYFLAKRRLFDAPGLAVVNTGDHYGLRLADWLAGREGIELVTFSARPGGPPPLYGARAVTYDASGASFTCETPDGPLDVSIPLPGVFNVENALAAIATTRTAFGVEPGVIVGALATVERVPGRFEPVDEGQDFAVLVDYAHTPDSLENVLRAARRLAEGRVHVVFGAGGDRDREKRPLMGAVATRCADRVIVTSDNPRSERPEAIVDAILAGVEGPVERELDRRAAIELAIETAEPGDVVVIAGKGHEQGQEFEGGRKEPFDDASVAREALRAKLGTPA